MFLPLTLNGDALTLNGEDLFFDDGLTPGPAAPLPVFARRVRSGPSAGQIYTMPSTATRIEISHPFCTTADSSYMPSAASIAWVTVWISFDAGPFVQALRTDTVGGILTRPASRGGGEEPNNMIYIDRIPLAANRRVRIDIDIQGTPGQCKYDVVFLDPEADTVDSYTTNFPTIENPISEGGRWLGGKTDAVEFGDAQCFAPGHVGASNIIKENGKLEDACMTANPAMINCGADQFVRTVVKKNAGFTPPSSHEMELLLRATVNPAGPNYQPMYEVLIPFFGTNGTIYHQNGLNPGYTEIAGITGPGWHLGLRPLEDGDIIEARITGANSAITISVYTSAPDITGGSFNLAMQVIDPHASPGDGGGPLYLNTGNPGLAFFCRSLTEPANRQFYQVGVPVIPVDGADPREYGVKSVSVGAYP